MAASGSTGAAGVGDEMSAAFSSVELLLNCEVGSTEATFSFSLFATGAVEVVVAGLVWGLEVRG
jgi:hypothetical protein